MNIDPFKKIEPSTPDESINQDNKIKTLFVSQLPYNYTLKDVTDIFQKYSVRVYIIMPKGFDRAILYANPKNQGIYLDAFVSFDTPGNAEAAMNILQCRKNLQKIATLLKLVSLGKILGARVTQLILIINS
ncbi:hypothetical protein HZS_1492 [Henneguya salminicola]|nr:hypothetical protein HZS_1492 [Henneguya salminicola]